MSHDLGLDERTVLKVTRSNVSVWIGSCILVGVDLALLYGVNFVIYRKILGMEPAIALSGTLIDNGLLLTSMGTLNL